MEAHLKLAARLRLQAEDLHMLNPASETVKCLSLGADAIEQLEAERDNAWAELRQIREAIGASPEESTLDEVRRVVAKGNALVAQVDEMREALKYYANFGDDGVPVEDVAKTALATPDDSAAILARRDAAIKE